jgi:hypothetical protein
MSGRSNKKRKFTTSLYGYVTGQTGDDKTLLYDIELKNMVINTHKNTIRAHENTITRQRNTIRILQTIMKKKKKERSTQQEAHVKTIERQRRELIKATQWGYKVNKTRQEAQENAKHAIVDITTAVEAANQRNPESLPFLTRIHQQLVGVLTDAQFQIITLEGIKEKAITHDQLLRVATVEICQLKKACNDLKEENNMFKKAFSAHSAASALVMRTIQDID